MRKELKSLFLPIHLKGGIAIHLFHYFLRDDFASEKELFLSISVAQKIAS
jgi:hypothetical protein